MEFDDKKWLAKLEKDLQDPERQAKYQERQAQIERELADELKRLKRAALDALGLPEKDLLLIASGEVRDTAALQELSCAGKGVTVLTGNAGCGKTTAVAVWLHRWITNDGLWRTDGYNHRFVGGSAMFMSAAKLSRWSRYNAVEMDKLLLCTRLAIDDLGAEYMDEKGSYMSLLDELINERYQAKRITVITTNMHGVDFKARYGTRITDRIRETGRFVGVGGDSLRTSAHPMAKGPAERTPARLTSIPAPGDDDGKQAG